MPRLLRRPWHFFVCDIPPSLIDSLLDFELYFSFALRWSSRVGTPLRIFLSSPSDVRAERLRAHLIIQKLARDYARFYEIRPELWEYEPMLASGHFQDWINPPSEADIVVVVLWSRLGTPLPEHSGARDYRGIDGRVPVTGTEWEFEDALQANRTHGTPDLLAYRCTAEPPGATLTDAEKRAAQVAQFEAVDRFWRRYFEDRGMFHAASASYKTLDEFDQRLEADLRSLIERRIQKGALGERAASTVTWLTGSPFRGLAAYEFADAPVFFGRDGPTRNGLTRLAEAAGRGTAFLLISGASGSGKSSLARAGLLPAVVAPKTIPEVGVWRRAVMRPGDGNPVLALAQALLAGDPAADVGLPEIGGPGATANDLAVHLKASADEPAFLFRKALAEIVEIERPRRALLPHEQARLLLLVDQFEELFTAPGISAVERDQFLRIVTGLARSGAVWVVATMRSDLWHRAVESKEFIALVEAGGRLELAAPDAAEILEIIRQPAAAAGLGFDVDPETGIGLDAVIAEAAAAEPGALPLISVLLEALYRRDVGEGEHEHEHVKSGGNMLTSASYRALGQLEGAIARRAEEVFGTLPGDVAAAFPEVLRALVTTSVGENVTARAAPLAEFSSGSPSRRLIDAFLAPDARLIVAQDGARGPEIRLAHEILLREWPRARDQLSLDRRDIETRTRIEGLLRRWQNASPREKHAALLSGLMLHEGEDLVARWHVAADNPLAVYVAQSEGAARSRTRRLVAGSLAVAATFAIVAAIATLNWHGERVAKELATTNEGLAKEAAQRAEAANRRSQVAEANGIAAFAQQLEDDGQGELASAVILQAVPRTSTVAEPPLTPAIAAALNRAIRRDHEIMSRNAGDNVLRAVVTKDGKTLVTGLSGGHIQIWSLPDMTLRHDIAAQDDWATELDISPDQSAVLVAGGRVPTVWDLRTGAKRFDLIVPNLKKYVAAARWSLDGQVIAAGTADNRLVLFNAADGKLLREINGPDFETIWKHVASRIGQTDDFSLADPAAYAVFAATFASFGAMTQLAFSPDSKTIAASGAADPDAAVRLYDVATGTLRATGVGPQYTTWNTGRLLGDGLVFDADGQRIAAIAGENNIQIYDASTGNLQQVLSATGTQSILFTRDGKGLVSAHHDGSIVLWCASRGKQVATFRAHRDSVGYLRFNEDETLFTASSDDHSATVWEMPGTEALCQDKDEILARIRALRPVARLQGDGDVVWRTLFLPGGRMLTASRDTTIRQWNLAERGAAGVPAPTIGGKPFSDSRVQAIFDPSGQFVLLRVIPTDRAMDTDQPPIEVWAISPPHRLGSMAAGPVAVGLPDGKIGVYQNPFSFVAFDPKQGVPATKNDAEQHDPFDLLDAPTDWDIARDGSRATGPRSLMTPRDPEDEGPFVLFDLAAKKELAELAVDDFAPGRHSLSVDAMADMEQGAGFSADGRLVIAVLTRGGQVDFSNDGTMLAAWDAATGQLVAHSDKMGPINSIAASDDGRVFFLVTGSVVGDSEGSLNLYGIRDGKVIQIDRSNKGISAQGPSSAWTVSPDGHLAATGDTQGLLHVWNVVDGSVAADLTVGKQAIYALAFSPDGRLIAVADASNTVQLIEVATGAVIAAPVLREATSSLRFDPTGKRVAALLFNGETDFIDVAPLPGVADDATAYADWMRASQLGWIPLTERLKLRLTPPPLIERPDLVALKPAAVDPIPQRPRRAAEAAKCDKLAADPDDREKPAPGVAFDALDGAAAQTACAAAVAAMPDDPVSLYEEGRALERQGKSSDAAVVLKKAADQRYGAAARLLASIIDAHPALASYGPAQPLWDLAAQMGDRFGMITVGGRRALAAQTADEFTAAISLAKAAMPDRLSAGILWMAATADPGDGSPELHRRVLFLYELGLWISDNVKQNGAAESDAYLGKIVGRVQSLSHETEPSALIGMFRQVRDWTPGTAAPAAVSIAGR
jgi:WD40 repeat protein